MQKKHLFKTTIKALVLGLLFGMSLTSLAFTNVTLQFVQNDGNGDVHVDNPTFGVPTLGPNVNADWLLKPDTTLRFKIEADSINGDVVFQLCKIGEATGTLDRPIDPPYVPLDPGVVAEKVITMTSANTNNGTVVELVMNQMNFDPQGLDRDTPLYFAIFLKNTGKGNSCTAIFNNTEVGVYSGEGAGTFRASLNLQVLYAHPSWDPDPAVIEVGTSIQFAQFGDVIETYKGKEVHGALAERHYRLFDDYDEEILAREWLFYKRNGGQLELVQTIPGNTSSTFVAGELCDVIPPEPPCNDTCGAYCLDTQSYVVFCRRYDRRGASSSISLDETTWGEDSFQYMVGHDVAQMVPIELYVGYQEGAGPEDVSVTPVLEEGYVLPRPMWVQPWHAQFNCWTSEFSQTYFRVRYSVEDYFGPGSVFVSDWETSQYSGVPSDVQNEFVPLLDLDPSNQTPSVLSSDEFPIEVDWQIKTPFGVTPWTTEPAVIKLEEHLSAPDLNMGWPTVSVLEPGSQVAISLLTTKPADAPMGVTYQGAYSVWLYDPMDPNEHVRLVNSGNFDCQPVILGNASEIPWKIPDPIPGDIGSSGKLALRVKFLWAPTSAGNLCNITTANVLNNFHAIVTGGLSDAVAGQATSPDYLTEEPSDNGATAMVMGGQENHQTVFDPSGAVDFFIDLQTSGQSVPTKLTWQWRRGNQVWRDGSWQAVSAGSDGPYSEVWPEADSNDLFANRWAWDWVSGRLRARNQNGGGAPAPFALDGTTNLIQAFFGSAGSVSVNVTLKVEFQEGLPVTVGLPLHLMPSHSDEVVTALVMKAGLNELSHYYGRLGDIPNLAWTVTTSTQQTSQVQGHLFKWDPIQLQWDSVYCNTLESNTLFDDVTSNTAPGGLVYTLTTDSAKTGEFHDVLEQEGPGHYQLRFSGVACAGDWTGALSTDITVNPAESFLLRFHYRDHLGSSAVSRAYTPSFNTNTAGSAGFQLKLDDTDPIFVSLYPEPAKVTHYTPFGDALGNVGDSEPDPRYTDHEYDPESGLNYMKGRFQLATYAKFNRPDPMRDWDWENPSSINLYEYVRNNPVMANDPDGYIIDESLLENEQLWSTFKSAVLATEHGQQLWDVLDSSQAVFKIQFKKLSKDLTQLGLVDNYQFNNSGELLSADISFDPFYMAYANSTVPSGKLGYEDAVDFGSLINKVAGVAHELKHGVSAIENHEIAKTLSERPELNKKIEQAVSTMSIEEYRKYYIENLKAQNDRAIEMNIKNEQSSVQSGNSVAYEFLKLQWKARRARIRAIKRSVKEYKKNLKE